MPFDGIWTFLFSVWMRFSSSLARSLTYTTLRSSTVKTFQSPLCTNLKIVLFLLPFWVSPSPIFCKHPIPNTSFSTFSSCCTYRLWSFTSSLSNILIQEALHIRLCAAETSSQSTVSDSLISLSSSSTSGSPISNSFVSHSLFPVPLSSFYLDLPPLLLIPAISLLLTHLCMSFLHLIAVAKHREHYEKYQTYT